MVLFDAEKHKPKTKGSKEMNQTNRADAERRYALPRVRFLNNLGAYQLTDATGVRVLGNDIESTYLRWVEIELDRHAYEDYDDFPAFGYVEDTARLPLLRTLAGSAVVLLIIATAAFICFAFR